MNITKHSFEIINGISKNQAIEIGGILGSDKNGTIVDVILDQPLEHSKCKYEYYPNVTFLNKEIEKWSQKGVVFSGVFHTHFKNSYMLSIGDKMYIEKIMKVSTEIIDHLYFPIYTLPNGEFTVYKAFFDNDKLSIIQEDLNVIEDYNSHSLDGCCNKIHMEVT